MIDRQNKSDLKSDSKSDSKSDPWRAPVALAQIPEHGLHRAFDADEAQRKALADIAGIRAVLSAHASFDVTPKSGGRYHVTGHVRARIGQTCVVTLDPVESDIDEAIDLMFAPPEQIPALSDLVDEATAEDEVDPPEPIEGGLIDLGRLATDALFLGIDPYPRRADAVFDHAITPPDPEDHPFAALKALKAKRKPKGR
jgi:uncharacterized metal-binding protein YceD (DUF177 family)